MATFTTRELRVAAILDVLTKARATNQRMGIPTTPDVFTAQFPTGHVAVVRWTEGVRGSDPKRQRAIEQATRHRAAYHLDLNAQPATGTDIVVLRDPQPVQRGREPVGAIVQDAVDDSLARQEANRARLMGEAQG